MGVVAINFIEVGSLYLKLLKISDCFRNNEETFEGLVEPKLEGKTKGRRTEAQI